MELLRTWVLGLAGAAVFCAVCTEMTPEGKVKGVQKMVCGIVMTIALMSPLLGFDFGSYSLNLSKYRQAAQEISASAEEISDSLSRTFIEERCAAYILDKARISGLEISEAKVTVRWSGEGVWYPVEAEIRGEYDRSLSEKIEEKLGINAENQHWNENEDT